MTAKATGKALVRWIPIVVALIVGGAVAMWPSLKFVNLGGAAESL